MLSFNEYARQCHEANMKWWQNIETGEPIERNKGELICLMHSEIDEASEGFDNNLMDDKLPNRKMFEVELIDCLIRIFDYCGVFGYDLDEVTNHRFTFTSSMNEAAKFIASALPLGDPDEDTLLMGVHKCLTDAMEAERKNTGEAATHFGATIGCILYIGGIYSCDLDGAFADKMAFNATREDHKHEARALAQGKKW